MLKAFGKFVTRHLASNDQARTDKEWEQKWRMREVYALWIAAAVGATAVIFSNIDAVKSRDEMRRQLEEMQAEQRPWVKISMVPNATFGSGDTGAVPISVTLSNVGKTPAFNIQPELWGYVVGTSHSDPVADQKIRCDAIRNAPVYSSAVGTTLFPGDVVPWNAGGGNFGAGWEQNDVEKYSRVENGRRVISLYLYGCVDYFFADRKVHHQTGFLYRIGYSMPRQGLPDALSFSIPIDIPLSANQLKLFADSNSSVPTN